MTGGYLAYTLLACIPGLGRKTASKLGGSAYALVLALRLLIIATMVFWLNGPCASAGRWQDKLECVEAFTAASNALTAPTLPDALREEFDD
jgi:hypothetical protein